MYGKIDPDGGYYNVSYDKNGQAWIWTKGQHAHPFLLPALLENENWIKERLGKEIKQEVEK